MLPFCSLNNLAADHYNCPVLQCNQRKVGLLSQASPDVLPLLCKILVRYTLCLVASNWKKMEFWGLEWNLNPHGSSCPHVHPVFLQPSQHQFKNIGKHRDVRGDEYKQALASMSGDMQIVRTQAMRAAKEESGTRHTGCHPCPYQTALLRAEWSFWTVSAWQQVSFVDLGLQMAKIPCDQSPVQGWTNHNRYLWGSAFGSPQAVWFGLFCCLHLEPLE